MTDLLQLDLVAEGIETKEQLEYLRNYNKKILGQGYYLCPPITTAQVESILEVNNYNMIEDSSNIKKAIISKI